MEPGFQGMLSDLLISVQECGGKVTHRAEPNCGKPRALCVHYVEEDLTLEEEPRKLPLVSPAPRHEN